VLSLTDITSLGTLLAAVPRNALKVHSIAQGSIRMQATPSWDKITTKLVDFSAVPFVLLLLPQLLKNAIALRAGNGDVLMGLAWVVRSSSR
jgi:hypothetical protein